MSLEKQSINIESMIEFKEQFEKFKQNILNEGSDYVIKDKKTYFMRLAYDKLCWEFNISTFIIKEEVEIKNEHHRTYHFTLRGERRNKSGEMILQITEDVQSVSTWDKKAGKTWGDCRAKALTKARKRCISNLTGGLIPYEDYEDYEKERKKSYDSNSRKAALKPKTKNSPIADSLKNRKRKSISDIIT